DVRTTRVDAIFTTLGKELDALPGAGVTLHTAIDEELYVLADAAQIEQLLLNLCVNAREAMPDGGTLTLSAATATTREYPFGLLPRDASRYVHLSIHDTGNGIADELLPRIFEPLFTTKNSAAGSGLGLTIAQQIAVAHGGLLFVETHPGEGTALHLFLPRAEAPAVASETSAFDFPLHVKRVLVVEDDDLVARALVAVLQSIVVETERVARGAAAPAAVESFGPDVVVLDYGLPDMTGGAVYSALRARWPTLPIVFVTGHADVVALREEVGGDDVEICFKPYEITRLLAAIARVVPPALE
ncbi:MAG: response regulator receiver sensor hybrid histidine kinase, partial [Acidobacteria bacterium]|nr:response regulator receiver sensor hybrid histidine kinase [Acidobacteriota bacterium]